MTGWLLRMAWRDSRGHRRRLLVAAGAVVAGVAALVALRLTDAALERTVDLQASAMLGADLALESHQPWPAAVEALLDSLPGERSRQVSFTSMVLFPRSGGTRLAQVRAVEGGFPYYGELGTAPSSAGRAFLRDGDALVDDGLLLQFEAQVGDSVKVGAATFRIAGRLLRTPGESALLSDVQPRVFVPLSHLEQTRLVRQGSRVEYRLFWHFPPGADIQALAASLRPRLREQDVELETPADRRRHLGHATANLDRLFGLGSFVALLLGGVGVASSMHTYARGKLATVAILRSLGATARQTVSIYLVQAGAMGLAGAAVGAAVGWALTLLLPWLLADLLPIELQWTLTAGPLIEGLAVGLGVSLLFAALPLLRIRRVSPLLALRASFEEERPVGREPLRWLAGLVLGGGAVLFAHGLTGRWDHAVGFAAGTGLAFALLALVAALLSRLARRLVPVGWAYVWRQGLANLYRPDNQTLVLLASVGLGTFLIGTLYLTQSNLLNQIKRIGGDPGQPNIVLFDIQTDQQQGVVSLLQQLGLPVLQQVPVVAMRLAAVKGEPVVRVRADSARGHHRDWALRHEYRATYRDRLIDTEKLVAGQWRGQVTGDTVFVSLEEGLAASLGVGVGDALAFDVQGVELPVVVGSLRQVDWRRISTNFLVVFPAGVLAEAPQFHVLISRAATRETMAELQRRVVRGFPNVSVIDLDLILSTADEVLGKISLVIRSLALFSVGTGLVVLYGVVNSSRYQRIRESVLLRTLGASRRQVMQIMLLEYLFLGGLAALTGLALALAGGWALSHYVFDLPFGPDWAVVPVCLLLVSGLTTAIGLAGSRGVHSSPPLEVLRAVG